jgi:hypothetical protein
MNWHSDFKLPQLYPLKHDQQPIGRPRQSQSKNGCFDGGLGAGGTPGGNSVAAGCIFG